MSQRATLLAIGCTLLVVLAIVWPRFFPRYVDYPGGALDRWTGETCRTDFSTEAGDLCFFDGGGHLSRPPNSARWKAWR